MEKYFFSKREIKDESKIVKNKYMESNKKTS